MEAVEEGARSGGYAQPGRHCGGQRQLEGVRNARGILEAKGS